MNGEPNNLNSPETPAENPAPAKDDIFALAEEKQRKAEEKKQKAEKKARRRALRKIRREENRRRLHAYPTFAPTKYFLLYIAFLIFTVVFTQALRSVLSAELMIFVIILPWVMIAYVLTGLAFVKESNQLESETVPKGVPLGYEILISNDSFIPYPYVEADIRYPAEDGVRCDIRRVSLSLSPLGIYRVQEEAVFRYRGGYEIGIQDIYVYDILRMFRVRLRVDNLRPVFVMPRRMTLPTDRDGAASDINTTEVRNMRGSDRTELTEIKQYQPGDGLRDIHWKMSSKTQDLMVKHYGMNACRSVYYLPDFGLGYTDELREGLYEEDIHQFCADAVTEMTIALVLSALRTDSNVCTILWYDRRAQGMTLTADSTAKKQDEGIGYAAEVMYNETDFERVYPYFATAPLHPAEYRPGTLSRLITETDGVSYVIVTARLDDSMLQTLQENIRDYSGAVLSGGLEIYYFNPSKKIRDPETRRLHEEGSERMIAQLRASGIIVHCFDSL